ncbi:hypothetical protein [Fodinicola acaciae]|uniref:hypothetical protein n=1 Tax=Fodinicola acaciae TaxID=2681555 RepID=UPI001C9E2827|nr:hypothetical protein [Fodinicola acaciae]
MRIALRRWPVLAGLGFAAFLGLGLASGTELAKVLAASAVVYIGAAALKRPAAAWPVFFATFIAIGMPQVLKLGFDPTWSVLGLGVASLVYGLVRRAENLTPQTIAMLGFGAVAAIALFVNPVVGGFLVAAGLLGHTAWDVYHHWKNKVVARSMAEFCMVLDTGLAAAIVYVTVTA